MLLIFCSLSFMLLAIDKENRFEWLCLSMLCALLALNVLLTDVTGGARYFIRSSLIFSFALFLASRWCLLAGYQAVILLMFLIANGCLLFDVAINRHFLIYNYFESVIYGLVTCQFMGVFIVPLSKIWINFCGYCASYYSGYKNKYMDDKI